MGEEGLVSSYTVAQYTPTRQKVNRGKEENKVNQEFDNRNYSEVIVSDLTYSRVGNQWNYVYIIVDLFNREIIGHSAGPRKNTELVKEAFASFKRNLITVQYFHSDRGMKFKSSLIDELIDTFGISRSLSQAGVPHDNAVAKAAFKSIKTEFLNTKTFDTLDQLKQELAAYK